jgi:hypothetical protein
MGCSAGKNLVKICFALKISLLIFYKNHQSKQISVIAGRSWKRLIELIK